MITCSDSRQAVPFPTLITETLYFLIISCTVFLACSTLHCGAVGYTTTVSNTLPVGSTTASLHPVRNAGSHPKTVLPSIGGCMRSCVKFFPKTVMAPSCAFSVISLRISLSMDGAMSRLYASSIASSMSAFVFRLSFTIVLFNALTICTSGASTLTVRNFSFSPRLIARTRYPVTLESGSLKS